MPKKKMMTLILVLCLCLLTGCAFSQPAEELYRLPKLPAEYESLEQRIDEMLSNGAEYAAPTAGSHLQSVQMIDLDGNGTEEAIAFFRKSTDEKPMKICLYRENDNAYEQFALIEGTASSLYSVEYSDLDGDGLSELLIAYKSGTGLQVLSVYSLANDTPTALLTSLYNRYTLFDADGDARRELAVFYGDESGRCGVDCYTFGGEVQRLAALPLSFAVSELRAVESGRLADGENALFVTGVSDGSVAVTDILTLYEENGHKTLRRVGDALGEMFWFLELYPTDMNGDGITEVPDGVVFPSDDLEGESYYRIDWRQYAADGTSAVVHRSFRNSADGWQIALKEDWDGIITLRRKTSSEENSVTFLLVQESGELLPFMSVYTITGETREVRATRGNRFALARQVDTVYAAEFFEANTLVPNAMDETSLRESFSLLVSDWTNEDN